MNSKKAIIITGSLVGFLSVLLVKLGNPMNMGFCVACFLRDITGSLGLHGASAVSYIRPEIIGLVLGAFISAMVSKEFQSRGGSSPFTRFVLGAFVMIGALMFLGCPLRMVLRIGGGDLNAIIGLIGFILGIVIGIFFFNKGFSLKRNYKLTSLEGYLFPICIIGLLVLLLASPTFISISEKGPGAMAAPIAISLAVGLIVGALSQKTRLCMVGGTRDKIMFKDNYLLLGFIAIIVSTLVFNIFFGFFNLGFENQPIAHSDALWNFLGMILVGWGSILLGGCPLRQLILSGEGNSDSVMTIIGMIVGASFAHNFDLASSPAGPTSNGKIAVVFGIIVVFSISYFNSDIFKNRKLLKGRD